ncbi:hypothetical protein GQ53DRAFT_732750 [Thozetella sp. PMI_491]|nr:hypothetical protein GQ53DRAFT_732750 [Thozetella sp. PMI_491]
MADTGDSPDGPGTPRRACDQCRSRKIRCDKETPCSNCRTAQRNCSSTGLGQKPKEARQRVLISHQYERKIDYFEARLAGIEDMLRNINTSLSRGDGQALPQSSTARVFTSPSAAESSTVYEEIASSDSDDDQAFEGNSSMTAHTVFASEFLEHAVTSTSLGRQLSPDIQSALASLQQMVHMQHQKGTSHESRFAHQKPLPKGGIKELPLPPSQIVVQLLREIKDVPPMTFALTCAFIAVEDFIECCRKVFFATEDYTLSTFIIVNAGLYYLFQEKAVMNEALSAELLRYHYVCRDNLETALANLPLLMPPRMDTIEALMLGATYAVEISKFTLAWQLNSAAAAMCQTLGWHRLPAVQDETTDKKSAIFWFSYMLDRGLSLRFGRSPVIQEWDISIPRHFGQINASEPWKAVLDLWIAHAGIMGQAYEQLYSPAGLARPPEQRTQSAQLLIEKAKLIEKRATEVGEAMRQEHMAEANPDLVDKEWRAMTMDLLLKSDDVSYWATLTLLYRAMPSTPGLPSTFNPECIDAARMAFKYHQECMEVAPSSVFMKAGYIHWTILYNPFVPFIVLFCHVIETSDAEDLQRLANFIATLQPVLSMSEAIEKLHRLCQVLYKVAALYVEAKAKQQQDQDMSMVGNDFDMYLSQLGLMTQQPQQGVQPSETVVDREFGARDGFALNQASQLGDWFSGNRHIMGLMEEDLSDFSPGGWPSAMGP